MGVLASVISSVPVRPAAPRRRFRGSIRRLGLAGLALGLGFGGAPAGAAAPPPAPLPPPLARPVDYAKEVRPLLVRHCFACHGNGQQKGGLRLDTPEDAARGGDSGPALRPGDSAGSLLIRYVAGRDRIVMPPSGPRLSAAQVALLRAWIDQGARGAGPGARPVPTHWAFVPPRRQAPPAVRRVEWVRNPIDRFILARLEREGIRPSPEADRRTLIRRLSLDLLGLPPTPEEVDAFVNDPAPDAYEQLVDRLLASPHFGERWGRHWLDVARYADSDGYEKDLPRPYAYLYRDWVIRAVNQDMPFDRFTIEQLAGDLLPNATLDQKIATGFHRNTLTNREGGVDPEEFRVKAVVDRVNTTGAVWLGLTVGCAECHSHKYDPLTQREYYGLFAFFNRAREAEIPAPQPTDREAKAAVLEENPRPPATHVHIRGDFLRKGEPVEPHTPAFLPPLQAAGPTPNRLDLARWLVDPAHPLTARVTVNRVWQHLFGRGIVATENDFGLRGEKPSHPELLDWLALWFVGRIELPGERRTPWSLKSLIRLIVTSATYRQSSAPRPDLQERDPKNVLLARQNRLRVEAEIVRDLYLAVSGLLNRTIGGPSIRPPLPPDVAALSYASGLKWQETTGPERYKRGMYIHFQRTVPFPSLTTFDAPDGNVTCTRRERSNTPLQALTLLNDPVFFEACQALGRQLAARRPSSVEEGIREAFRICLSREPTERETARLARFHAEIRQLAAASPPEATRIVGKVPEGTEPAEAAAWVLVARAIMNLDEFVTRE